MIRGTHISPGVSTSRWRACPRDCGSKSVRSVTWHDMIAIIPLGLFLVIVRGLQNQIIAIVTGWNEEISYQVVFLLGWARTLLGFEWTVVTLVAY